MQGPAGPKGRQGAKGRAGDLGHVGDTGTQGQPVSLIENLIKQRLQHAYRVVKEQLVLLAHKDQLVDL